MHAHDLRRICREALTWCLNTGQRSFREVLAHVEVELDLAGVTGAERPSRHAIQTMVSRLVTEDHPRTILTCHTKPPRYVSLDYLEGLEVSASVDLEIDDDILRSIESDLRHAMDHYNSQHARLRERFTEAYRAWERVRALQGQPGVLYEDPAQMSLLDGAP